MTTEVRGETSFPPRDGTWYKSSYSCESMACVEVSMGGGDHILVRDSKYRRDPANDAATQPILSFTPSEWQAFTAGVIAGEFELP